MKVISCIKQPQVIEHILRHCKLWKDTEPRPPPEICATSTPLDDPLPDYSVFEDLPSYDN